MPRRPHRPRRSAPATRTSSQHDVRMDGTVTRQLGKDVTVGRRGGYSSGRRRDPRRRTDQRRRSSTGFTATDVTAFLNSKHFEVARLLERASRATTASTPRTIGQSLLPADFNLNVVDAEAQYIDQFETGKGIDHDLHLGVDVPLQGGRLDVPGAAPSREPRRLLRPRRGEARRKHLAVVGDYRADYVPYLERIVQSPRGSVLFHPTKQSTIRGIVGTAFRTPTSSSRTSSPARSSRSPARTLASQAQRSDQPGFKRPARADLHDGARVPELGERLLHARHARSSTTTSTTSSSSRPTAPITVGDLGNPQRADGLNPQTGSYPLFLGGFENQCQTYNVYGAELGVRVFPVEGLDVYANYTLMDVEQDNARLQPRAARAHRRPTRARARKVQRRRPAPHQARHRRLGRLPLRLARRPGPSR